MRNSSYFPNDAYINMVNPSISLISLQVEKKETGSGLDELTHYGLVMPYGDIYVSQHWFREWLVAWWHQTINSTNADLSWIVFCGIHQRAISQMLISLICNMQSIGRSPHGDFRTTLSCPTVHFSPTSWPSRGSVARLKGRERLLAAFNVTLLILVLEIPFNF